MQLLQTGARPLFLASLLAAVVLWTLAASAAHATPLVVAKTGNPAWNVVDAHTVTAPLGTADDGYAEFGATLASILPPPHHLPHPQLGIGPGAAHPGPYDTEMGAGVAANGYAEKAAFTASDFSNGQAVYLAFTLTPDGSALGSSPDFASGPIISNTLCPIHSVFETWKNGALFDQTGSFDVPALNDPQLTPSFNVDGHSHIPMFYADNFDFAFDPAAGIAGEYQFRITLTDALGNGYSLVDSFTVTPEPVTLGCLIPVFVTLSARRRAGVSK